MKDQIGYIPNIISQSLKKDWIFDWFLLLAVLQVGWNVPSESSSLLDEIKRTLKLILLFLHPWLLPVRSYWHVMWYWCWHGLIWVGRQSEIQVSFTIRLPCILFSLIFQSVQLEFLELNINGCPKNHIRQEPILNFYIKQQ